MQKTCRVCGKEFESTQSKAKYCSKECRSVSATKNRKPVQKYTFKCQHCGKEYHPKDKRRSSFCSRECSYAEMSKLKTEKELIKKTKQATNSNKICRVCGKSYQLNRLVRGSVCSDECRKEEGRQYYQKTKEISLQKLRDKYQPKPKKKTKCIVCGLEFMTNRRKTCSNKCSKKLKDKGEPRKRARKHGVDYEPVNPIEIFIRDSWVCQICGRKTPQQLRGHNKPSSPELDHIIPISKGGAHMPSNLQCACRRCNGIKSNNTEAGQLRLL